ncbi:MAG: DUF924 family protein [Pseudomonadota bacterium]
MTSRGKSYDYQNVLDFWFSRENKPKWFDKDKDFDQIITDKFLDLYEAAAVGALDAWKESAFGVLALIIILDQFPRNMFRNDAKSFASDTLALSLTKEAIARNMDKALNTEQKQFLCMPLMHSEDLEDQHLSVEIFAGTNASTYATMHMEIIARFGRFPHRNNVLGRKSTEEEIRFLTTPNSSF